MDLIFFDVTVILVVAAIVSIIFKIIKQPAILAYIVTGIIIGPLGLLPIENKEVVRSMAEIGVALLLFMLGLELKINDLKSVGKVALITGVGQIVFTSIIGFLIITSLGISFVPALYVAMALTLSSTIITVKLLSDKKDINSLYGKISVGFLLVQDVFAIMALIVLSGFAQVETSFSLFNIGWVLLKGLILFLVVLFLSIKVFPAIIDKIARSPEVLFLFSIAWAFGLSAFVSSPAIGFSIEIGGFLAGLALANSIESGQISSRTKSLRDFFIIIFFVTLGMGMAISDLTRMLVAGIVLSLFVLVGNPIVVMIIMGLLGYRKRTSFLAGLTVAQISEFSLIIIFLGNKLGHVSQDIISLITLVGIITFGASCYMIINSNSLFKFLSPYLDIFERRNTNRERKTALGGLKDHIILAGVNRAGRSILNSILNDNDSRIIAVDFNPDVVRRLEGENVMVVFGDVTDPDILSHTRIDAAKILISTISDAEDNLHLIKAVRKINSKVKIIVIAQDKYDAINLYGVGADYVVIPHLTGGRFIARLLKEDRLDSLEEYKERDLKTPVG